MLGSARSTTSVLLSMTLALIASPASGAGLQHGPGLPCTGRFVHVPTPIERPYDLEVFSSQDVWVVGKEAKKDDVATSAAWDGSAWTEHSLPSSLSEHSSFVIGGSSPRDVWLLAGSAWDDPPSFGTARWNGRRWTAIPLDTDAILDGHEAIDSSSGRDAWMVGRFQRRPAGLRRTAILYWDGSSWSASPHGSMPGRLNGLHARTADDVWAVGSEYDDEGVRRPLALHHDGAGWAKTPTPSIEGVELLDVAALGPDDAWAVGLQYSSREPSSVVLYWDGVGWSSLDVPDVGAASSVAVAGPEDVWVDGDFDLMHWDGERWSVVGGKRLVGETAAPGIAVFLDGAPTPDGVWARQGRYAPSPAHLCPAPIGDDGFDLAQADLVLGESLSWRFVQEGGRMHRVRTEAGLGLFDSGPLPAGSWFAGRFIAAGRFRVVETVSRDSLVVQVVPQTIYRPSTNTISLYMGAAALPPSLVFDAQVREPGSASFEDLILGTRQSVWRFVADAGPGAYEIRARVRNTGTGVVSGWSPAAVRVVD